MGDARFVSAHIETRRMLLRPFKNRDLSAFIDIASEEEVLAFLPSTDRMTREQLTEVFVWLRECYESNTIGTIRKFTLAVALKRTGKIIGWCGLGPLEYNEFEIEFYFVISHRHWGRGFATEAARALLGYALGVLGIQALVAVVHPSNRASIRVIEKLGMRPEGVVHDLPAAHHDYEGHARYSLDAGDWPVE